jgi:hypothetical protein
VLKTVVASREFAISFAGDVGIGLAAVRAFASRVNSGALVEDVERELLQTAIGGPGSVEFIIARAVPNSRLTRIRSSGIERDLLARIRHVQRRQYNSCSIRFGRSTPAAI